MGFMEEIRVIVSQFGARMHYAVPVTFERAGMLHRFYTDFYASPRIRRILSIANHHLKLMFLRRAAERYHPEIPLNKIKMQPLLGIFFNLGRVVFRKNAERHHRMTVKIVEKFHHKINSNDLNFSFSGLKTSVLYKIQEISKNGVEIDESYFGPRRQRGKRGRGAGKKIVVKEIDFRRTF